LGRVVFGLRRALVPIGASDRGADDDADERAGDSREPPEQHGLLAGTRTVEAEIARRIVAQREPDGDTADGANEEAHEETFARAAAVADRLDSHKVGLSDELVRRCTPEKCGSLSLGARLDSPARTQLEVNALFLSDVRRIPPAATEAELVRVRA